MHDLDFPFLSIYQEQLNGASALPLVGAMFTQSHLHYAKRLFESCQRFQIPCVLYCVPTVHRSISPKGSDDLRFTKANFISFLLKKYSRPILYIDSDCYVARYPTLLETLVSDGYDFAIYNWLAEEHTEAYVPIPVTLSGPGGDVEARERFYVFSHSIDYYAVDQLICSGAVQYYGNTENARILLRAWHDTISRFPTSCDDHCMDYSFNNRPEAGLTLKRYWFSKEYARYAWWIYERPVINHPDIPFSGNTFAPIPEADGRKRVYLDRTEKRNVDYVFPKDLIVDVDRRMLIKKHDERPVPVKKFEQKIWI